MENKIIPNKEKKNPLLAYEPSYTHTHHSQRCWWDQSRNRQLNCGASPWAYYKCINQSKGDEH